MPIVVQDPYCYFDSLYTCGIDADENSTLSADIGNYTNVTQIRFMMVNPYTTSDILVGTRPYNGNGTYTATFNMATTLPFSTVFPELISNPLDFYITDQN